MVLNSMNKSEKMTTIRHNQKSDRKWDNMQVRLLNEAEARIPGHFKRYNFLAKNQPIIAHILNLYNLIALTITAIIM